MSKSSLSWSLLLCCFCGLVGFLTLSLVKKEVFLLSHLQVYQVSTETSQETTTNTCTFFLNWKKQPIPVQEAVLQIQEITGLKGEFILDLNEVFLHLKDDQTIFLENFNTDCQWLFRPVLVRLPKITLLKYLLQQIFDF